MGKSSAAMFDEYVSMKRELEELKTERISFGWKHGD